MPVACPVCNAPAPDGAASCPQCGHPIPPASPAFPEPPGPSMTPPPAPPDLPAEARTGDGIHWNYNRICIVDAKASGYVTGTWVHHPSAPERVSHAAMNGRTFKLDVGLWDPVERRNVLPGELESCSCTFTAAEKKKKGCFGAAALFALAPLAALAWRLFG